MPKKKLLTIDGNRIGDIASFYDEINRVFMAGENWKIGPSLDALNDMFYGGYGAMENDEFIVLAWQDIEKSRARLGRETTREFYLEKLRHPQRYDQDRIRKDLAGLENGGPTFFDTVLEIIADHPNIELVAR